MDLEQRFWSRVDQRHGCWLWTGSTTRGYGTIQNRRKSRSGHCSPEYAHRVSVRLAGATLLDDDVVMHHCDNRLCVHPGHLSIGTHRDNMADAASKGRINRKLSIGEAAAIIEAKKAGARTSELAFIMNVATSTIKRIVSGRIIDGVAR